MIGIDHARAQTRLSPRPSNTPISESFRAGMRMIVNSAIRDLERHDERFALFDRDQWQVDYSLRGHIEDVRHLMFLTGRARGLSEYEVFARDIEALYHDKGKEDKECLAYRINDRLNPEQKVQVDKHPDLSGRRLLELARSVPPEYVYLLYEAYPVVCSHHKPYMITDPRRRQDGFDLKFNDALVARREVRDKHHRVMSLAQAIESMEHWVDILSDDPLYRPFRTEMEASRDSILDLEKRGLILEVYNR